MDWTSNGTSEETIASSDASYKRDVPSLQMMTPSNSETTKPVDVPTYEDDFFQNLYDNPNIDHTHPLSHLISSSVRLQDRSSDLKQLKKKYRRASEIRPGIKGSQTSTELIQMANLKTNWDTCKASGNPYKVKQHIKASKKKDTGSKKQLRKMTHSKSTNKNFGNLQPIAYSGSSSELTSKISHAESNHKQFLMDALRKVSTQVSYSEPLETIAVNLQEHGVNAHETILTGPLEADALQYPREALSSNKLVMEATCLHFCQDFVQGIVSNAMNNIITQYQSESSPLRRKSVDVVSSIMFTAMDNVTRKTSYT